MRGHIRPWRKPGTYKLWIEHPKLDGKRKRETLVFHGTRKEAEAKLAERVADVERGDYSRSNRSTVGEVAEQWLKARKESVGAKTYDGYQEVVRDYIKPAIGDLPIRKLSPLHIEAALAKWREKGARERKLKQRTLYRVFATLKTMLKQAVRWNVIVRNPCDGVTSPAKGRPETIAIDERKAIALLKGLEGTALAAPVHFALLTGMRRSELLALTWDDIDFEGRALTVRRAVEQVRPGESAFKDTKTLRSRRAVPLMQEAIDLLTAHRAEQNQVRLHSGGSYNRGDLVFPNPATGSVWDPGRFSEAFRRAAGRIGISVTFHGLRHSFATIALRAGVPMKVVSDILGHTTTAITADLYTHTLEDMEREAADRVGIAIAAARHKAG